MLSPSDFAPTSNAPRFAASMMPGPPPVINDHAVVVEAVVGAADEPPELARHVVVVALGEDALGDRETALQLRIAWVRIERRARFVDLGAPPRPARRRGSNRTRRWYGRCRPPPASAPASCSRAATARRARRRVQESPGRHRRGDSWGWRGSPATAAAPADPLRQASAGRSAAARGACADGAAAGRESPGFWGRSSGKLRSRGAVMMIDPG